MSFEQTHAAVSNCGADNAAIRVENVSKSYRIYPGNKARLRQIFFPQKKFYEEFWALKDVSLSVERGSALGVIGLNGAGKSTLLQLVAGILRPTAGPIRLDGHVSALLELGTGFNPYFTGRENVYMNGAVMGFSRKKMDEKLEDIMEFAGIGDFFDRPIRMYSSGMKVRLGFAVAVNLDPDILLVDEVLSVGDFTFQQKCLEKIQQMRDRMSIIFVSHGMANILRFCDRAVVLNKGRVDFEGEPEEAVVFYMGSLRAEEESQYTETKLAAVQAFQGTMYCDEESVADVEHRWVDKNGECVGSIEHGGEIALEFSFRLMAPVRNLILGIPLWDESGNLITAFNTDVQKIEIVPDKNGLVKGRLRVNSVTLKPGEYYSVMAVVDGPRYLYRKSNAAFRIDEVALHFGFITLDHEWEFLQGGQ